MKSPFIFLFLTIISTFLLNGQIKEVKETASGISKRLQHEIDITKDPNLGYVPKFRLNQANEVRERLLTKYSGNRSPLVWTERGPFKDVVGSSNGNTRPGTGAITSGRVRAMWVDLADPTGNTVWVGGIDGGIWKTNDISVRPATWTLINDFLGNLAVGSICQDPTNHNIMYFGTGEKAINADAVRGSGVWMSNDHGVTWSLMPGTTTFWNVSKVICDAQGNLYVGCNSTSNNAGLRRYTKSTGTWADISPSGLDKRVPDLELSSTGRLHIVCGYFNSSSATSGYRYTDNAATVTSTTWSSPSTTFPCNYNVALSSNGNTLYALPSNASWQVPTIYKSTNGGVNWTATGTTPAFTSGQAWYCMAVAIDPNNANNVIVGSLDCYRSTNGGTSWSKISNWVGTTGQYVHADQQSMIWRPNNRVIVASDGGIHVSPDGGTTFNDRNEGLRIKQFYSVAIHPTSTNYFLGGTQDNGTHSMNAPGLASSIEVTGGDGAFSHIDQDNGNYQFGAYVYNQYRRSTNGGSSWSSINYSSSAGRFINPTDYDDVNNIMYCSGNANQYVIWTNPQTGSTFSTRTVAQFNNGKVSALKVSPYTNHTVYFAGQASGVASTLVKVTNANATTPTITNIGAALGINGANISNIELGTNEQNIIVTFSNYGINNVWVTSNGGTNWSQIDGNLPDMPVRWAMFYPGDNTKAIIATETGVWQTSLINGSSTLWNPETSFPNVRTDMLQYRASDGLLAAATHGRGIFTAALAVSPTCGAVAGLASSNITTNSATISWNALSGAISYDVDYKVNTSSTWTNLATGTTALTQNLSGLSQNTTYDYRVRANCSGATGVYTQAQFTSLSTVTCNTPTGLSSSNITSSAATVSWSVVSGATNYTVEYKLNSASTWTTAAASTTSLTVNLTGLTASSLYDWRVRTNCSGGSSAFAQAQFTTATASACPGVYDVSTNGTISGAATIPFNTDVFGLINPSGDNDYYKFVITTGGTATTTLTNLPANYNLRIYNSSGSLLASSTLNSTNNESIARTYTPGTYYARVNGQNSSAFNATNCYTLKVQLGTAAGQELNGDNQFETVETVVNLFPNPTKDRLNIYIISPNSANQIKIFDVAGKMIYQQNVNEMLTTLDVDQLAKGMYFVKVIDEEGVELSSQKFVKE
jgi:trimeric autotransporter adhesin